MTAVMVRICSVEVPDCAVEPLDAMSVPSVPYMPMSMFPVAVEPLTQKNDASLNGPGSQMGTNMARLAEGHAVDDPLAFELARMPRQPAAEYLERQEMTGGHTPEKGKSGTQITEFPVR